MDDIQRRLALIDAQLAGPTDLHQRIISTSPLLFAAIGLIAGILIQDTLLGSRLAGHEERFTWGWLVLLAVCAITAIFLFAVQKQASPRTAAYTALAAFICLGTIRLITFNQSKPNDIRNLIGDKRTLATIRGLIVTEPYISRNQRWKFAKFTYTDPHSSFYLKICEVETTAGWAKATGTVRVQVDEPVLDLKAGDYIHAYCWLDRFRPPRNPGQFDTAKYLARKNILVAASVKSGDSIQLLQSSSAGLFTKLKRKLRQTATQALLTDLSDQDQSRGLLEALLLGYRGNIHPKTYDAFRKTGLLHFISLSGMHLGILMGIIWWLCKTAGLMKRARAIICIIAIAVFLLIVPPRAPTVRAAIICWVFCASFLFRRRFNSLNTLSLAAIILLLIRPTQLFEAGWQLSFASVLGLVLFCQRIHFFLYEKIAGLPWPKKAPKARPFFRIISRPSPYLLRLFSTGLTAWLGGAGILLYHFYTINPLTCIWTVAVFPLVAAILTIGFLKIILSFLLPTAAAALALTLTALVRLLTFIVEHIASWDVSQILMGRVPVALIILYYCLIFFVAFARFQRPLMKKAICTVTALAIIVLLGVTKWQGTHPDNLVLTTLDVGHGQAILTQLPSGTNILFDAGSMHRSNIGRRIVLPFLNHSGISKVDAIIISHNDIDHINGISEIAESCRVDTVYANDALLADIETDPCGTARLLDTSLREQGLAIQPLRADLPIGLSAGIRVLWPSEQICQDQTLDDNDKSIVTLIEFAGKKILLCSDIEKFAQKELLRLFPNLKADIVVVPHHSSPETLDGDFLRNLDADILICSSGQRQYEKQQIISYDKVKSLFTARDGAIKVSINKHGLIKTDVFAKSQ